MPTDIIGNSYGAGDLVAVAVANAGTSGLANMNIVLVEEIITHDKNGDPITQKIWDQDGNSHNAPSFIVKGRPCAQSPNPYSSVRVSARLRQYIKSGNIIALPGRTIEDIRTHAMP